MMDNITDKKLDAIEQAVETISSTIEDSFKILSESIVYLANTIGNKK
jgi:hypothetical protein